MAQHDYIIANQSGAAFRSDLNNGLAAIVSQNSGSAQPSTTYAYQWWADTTTGLLKLRNAANNAWITIGTLADTNLGLLSLGGGTMTGAVLADDASTAALPAIAFDGDPDTGIFRKGANQLGLSAGGTERAFVDSNGVTIQAQGDLRLADSDNSNWVALQAPATVATNLTLTAPAADGSADQALVTDGAGGLSFASRARFLHETSVPFNGLAQTDFVSIPTWVKRITVLFDGVSVSGSSNPLIQIGDSGGIENTGYAANAMYAAGDTNYTIGFGIESSNNANLLNGAIVLTRLTAASFTWVAIGSISVAGANGLSISGKKTLSAALDRLRFTTVLSADTFDAGTLNLVLEG